MWNVGVPFRTLRIVSATPAGRRLVTLGVERWWYGLATRTVAMDYVTGVVTERAGHVRARTTFVRVGVAWTR